MTGDLVDQAMIGVSVLLLIALIVVLTGTHKKLSSAFRRRRMRAPKNRYPDDKPQAFYSNRR